MSDDRMKARQYAPVAPLDVEPIGPFTDPQQRREALTDALRDVDLGTYDQRLIEWCAKRLDNSTLRVIVSWLERTRGAGMTDVLDAEIALRERNLNRGGGWDLGPCK